MLAMETTVNSLNSLTASPANKKRIVRSIDTAVNVDGYNPFPIPYESIFKVENNKKSDVIRTFQNFLPRGNIDRNNSANIITGRQGLQPKAQNTPSPHTAFELYFTADILQSIVLHTNTKFKTLYQNCQIILSLKIVDNHT